jgi:hypothetical protein
MNNWKLCQTDCRQTKLMQVTESISFLCLFKSEKLPSQALLYLGTWTMAE